MTDEIKKESRIQKSTWHGLSFFNTTNCSVRCLREAKTRFSFQSSLQLVHNHRVSFICFHPIEHCFYFSICFIQKLTIIFVLFRLRTISHEAHKNYFHPTLNYLLLSSNEFNNENFFQNEFFIIVLSLFEIFFPDEIVIKRAIYFIILLILTKCKCLLRHAEHNGLTILYSITE